MFKFKMNWTCPMFIEQVLVHLSGIYPDHPTLYPIPLKSHPALHSISVKAQIKKIQMCAMVKLVESPTAGISIWYLVLPSPVVIHPCKQTLFVNTVHMLVKL